MSTGQFGGLGNLNLTDVFPTAPGSSFSTNFPSVNMLNLFLFRPDLHLGAAIQALQQKNVLQILAEPNLIALNGKEASFLAGGEFPFPVVQPSQGYTAVTIVFKEFGVRLKFTPQILPNGNIHLHVAPEVSSLDFSNALTISGFTIPALSTRRTESELEVQDGQSFVIAGLMDNRLNNIDSKFPGLGDIPIIGTFFKSKNHQKSTSELMVLVTAHRINASSQPAPLPKFPEKFLGDPNAPVPGAPAGPSGALTPNPSGNAVFTWQPASDAKPGTSGK
jgi:pilus assembly protein CpaC